MVSASRGLIDESMEIGTEELGLRDMYAKGVLTY